MPKASFRNRENRSFLSGTPAMWSGKRKMIDMMSDWRGAPADIENPAPNTYTVLGWRGMPGQYPGLIPPASFPSGATPWERPEYPALGLSFVTAPGRDLLQSRLG